MWERAGKVGFRPPRPATQEMAEEGGGAAEGGGQGGERDLGAGDLVLRQGHGQAEPAEERPLPSPEGIATPRIRLRPSSCSSG